jgi:hypothetical protein
MQMRIQLIVIVCCLVLIVLILDLIRRGRLREEYALIWLVCIAIAFVLAIFRGSLQLLADWLGIDYGPSAVFMVGLVLVGFIQLLQTIAISKLTVHNRDLAQVIAILQWKIRELGKISELEDAEMMAARVEPEVEPETESLFAEQGTPVAQSADGIIRED